MVVYITQIFTTILDVLAALLFLIVLGTTQLKPSQVMAGLLILLSYIMSIIYIWR